MCLGAEADGGCERLTGEHVRAVKLAANHTVEQHFPVGLRLQRHVEAFFGEVAFLFGDRERRHVGEFDEAELQIGLFDFAIERGCHHGLAAGCLWRTAASRQSGAGDDLAARCGAAKPELRPGSVP